MKDANERVSKTLTTIANLAGSQAIDAFDAATDILNLRLLFLRRFLDETDPPEQVIGSQGKAYPILPIRDATLTEAIFSAGEEALKRLPVEVAGQIPLISAGIAILKIAYDVREKQRSLNERRALGQQIINAPYQRNIADATLDGLEIIREDDEEVRGFFNSLSAFAEQLLIIAKNLPNTL